MEGTAINGVFHADDQYTLGTQLSQGAGGSSVQSVYGVRSSVYAAVRHNPEVGVIHDDLAIKLIPLLPDQARLNRTCREVTNLSKLHGHPHITELHDICATDAFISRADSPRRMPAIGIVMPRAQGNLEDYLNKVRHRRTTLPDSTVLHLFRQLVLAVHYCHLHRLSQRDIKPANFLLFPGSEPNCPTGKLCDLGWSVDISHAMTPEAGTPLYQAPEIPVGDVRRRYDATLADVWSCGVVLLHMLVPHTFDTIRQRISAAAKVPGAAPVASVRWLQELRTATRRRNRTLDTWPIPDTCYQLLEAMLQEDPQQRITLIQVMGHPWFRQGLPPNLDLVAFNERVKSEVPPLLDQDLLQEWLRVKVWGSVREQGSPLPAAFAQPPAQWPPPGPPPAAPAHAALQVYPPHALASRPYMAPGHLLGALPPNMAAGHHLGALPQNMGHPGPLGALPQSLHPAAGAADNWDALFPGEHPGP